MPTAEVIQEETLERNEIAESSLYRFHWNASHALTSHDANFAQNCFDRFVHKLEDDGWNITPSDMPHHFEVTKG